MPHIGPSNFFLCEACQFVTTRTLVLYSALLLYEALVTATLDDQERSFMSSTTTSSHTSRAEREIRLSWIFFALTFITFILSGIWSIVVGTASPGANESDLIQGWEGVLRNLPGYLLLIVVPSLSVWFATQAGTDRSPRARLALIASSLVLLFALTSVTRDIAEVVMTTRAATASWILFVINAAVVACVYLVTSHRIRSASSR